jgi:RimJ/RimL family protein N-acetyltransferase
MSLGVMLRRWRKEDSERLAELANNRKIWINLRDRFPFPYTKADAEAWIAHCEAEKDPATQFAIEVEGELVGGIGFEALSDERRLGAEIGYWIGEPSWEPGVDEGTGEGGVSNGGAAAAINNQGRTDYRQRRVRAFA